jgi:hypothetical protein
MKFGGRMKFRNHNDYEFVGSIVKLWLFIPGRNETINATIQSAVTGLKGD